MKYITKQDLENVLRLVNKVSYVDLNEAKAAMVLEANVAKELEDLDAVEGGIVEE